MEDRGIADDGGDRRNDSEIEFIRDLGFLPSSFSMKFYLGCTHFDRVRVLPLAVLLGIWSDAFHCSGRAI